MHGRTPPKDKQREGSKAGLILVQPSLAESSMDGVSGRLPQGRGILMYFSF